jgi:hypothetical protein
VLPLLLLGLVIVAFGALVLLRFPDSPGGELRLLGLRVRSVGAGLPLIALGVAVAIVAVSSRGEDGATSADSGDSSGSGGGGVVSGPPPDDAPRCLAGWFAAAPNVSLQRQRTLPAGIDDVKVLVAEESKHEEFAVVPTADSKVLGAVKMSYDTATRRFRIDGMVDAACRSLAWTASDVPGASPASVGEVSHLRARFGAATYELELKPNSTEMEMELHLVRR